jgi:iron complex outermembrane receptor protein
VPTRVLAVLAILWLGSVRPAAAQTPPTTLKQSTLEELLDLEVTTPARLPQARVRSGPAVFVITQDDIHRSGATTLPELLRLAPGVQVGRIDANKWAVGIRGFADRLSRAMLVMIDGRAVYSPLFAGTYWEVQNLLLEDIDRIEVIRGPGGTLWGSNAVTGIVNVITKTASASEGAFASVEGGSSDLLNVGVRLGRAPSPAFQYRLSGRFSARAPQYHKDGSEFDSGHIGVAAIRADWTRPSGIWSLSGGVYQSLIGQRDTRTTYEPPRATIVESDDTLSGGHVLGRWDGQLWDGHDVRLQGFFDLTRRNEAVVAERRHTFDLDFQDRVNAGRRHALMWGTGLRVTSGRLRTEGTLRFVPPDRTETLVSAFVQDDITLVPDTLSAAVGVKLERNDYSGVELQPSVQLAWSPSTRHTLVAAVAHAVRTPSRVEREFESGSLLNAAVPRFVRLTPNPTFDSEKLTAFEVGQTSLVGRVLGGVSVFYNRHSQVLSTEAGPTFVETTENATRQIVPVLFANGLQGRSYGVEATADIRPLSWWRWHASYSYLRIALERAAASQDLTQETRAEGGSPRHLARLRASLDLPGRVGVDWMWRRVSALPAIGVSAYATSDLRVSWALTPAVELFAIGGNLHDEHHREFPSTDTGDAEIRRAVTIGMRWTR